MNEKIFKNKKAWLVAVISLFIILSVSFHIKLRKKSYALETLQKASNLTMTQTTPGWVKFLPRAAVKYLEPTFPVKATFSLEEPISILEEPEGTAKKTMTIQEASRLLGDLGNVAILNVDCSRQPEIDFVEYIDSILNISSLQQVQIIGNRLKIKETHSLPALKEITIECTDISESIFDILAQSRKLQKVHIRTKAYLTGQNLKKLAGLHQLQYLDLDGLKCDETELSFLSNMKKLEVLNLSSYKEQIINSWGEGDIKLPGGFKINKALVFLKNSKKLNKISAIVELNIENLEILNHAGLYPTAYYRFPHMINDKYLQKLGDFLDHFNAAQDSVVKGMMANLNLNGQKGVSDLSLPFLKKYKPPYLDLRGTAITRLRDLPLDTCTSILLPENSNIEDALPAITAKDYDLIDFRGSKISDFVLAKLLKQCRPKKLFLDGQGLTEKSIDNAMEYFNYLPNSISKVSFGSWDIPQKRRLEFLGRVHQWGMSVVYSSHLTPDLLMRNWHVLPSMTIDHDRVGNLAELYKILPSLKTLVLRGLPLSGEEWKSFHKLKELDYLYLESPNSGKAINASKILTALLNFDIKNSMLDPVKLTNNLDRCRVFLKHDEKLENVIDLSEGCPRNLVIDGLGTVDLQLLNKAENLRSLTIGPDIAILGEMPQLSGLESIKCLSQMQPDSLRSMGNIKNIKILLLNCETLTSESFAGWNDFKSLQVLDLSASNLQEKDLKHLQDFPSLRVLNLPAHQGISADILPVLERNSQLMKLNIIGTSILPKDLGDKYIRPGHWDYDL